MSYRDLSSQVGIVLLPKEVKVQQQSTAAREELFCSQKEVASLLLLAL